MTNTCQKIEIINGQIKSIMAELKFRKTHTHHQKILSGLNPGEISAVEKNDSKFLQICQLFCDEVWVRTFDIAKRFGRIYLYGVIFIS